MTVVREVGKYREKRAVRKGTFVHQRIWGVARHALVPVGYPTSVAEEYFEYQCWDTVQALCSYLRGIMSTTALLEAAGVGSGDASAAAAALAWVLRDGFATLSSLVFSVFAGAHFDDAPKLWRLVADLSNDIGLTLDVVAPLACGKKAGSAFVLLTGLSAALKTVCGVAAGATKAVVSAHMARRDNFGDVAAKEAAQETLVTLLGLLVGLPLTRSLENNRVLVLAVFAFLTVFHLYANVKAVRCLRLRALTAPRLHLLCKNYFSHGKNGPLDRRSVALAEPVVGLCWWKGPINLGAPMPPGHAPDRVAADLREFRFALIPTCGAASHIDVVLRTDADADDCLKATFRAAALLHGQPAASFDDFRHALLNHGWHLDAPHLHPGPHRYDVLD